MSTVASLQPPSRAPAAGVASKGAVLQRKCACGAAKSSVFDERCDACKSRTVQKKLAVGASDDPLELEADRVAEQVLAGELPAHGAPAAPRIQRLGGSVGAQTAPASVELALAGPGLPLQASLRHDMEQRFGHDFSRVRVHCDAQAQDSARDVNAQAYTAAEHVVFGAGRFEPGTPRGRRLIAHELTHVVQQSAASPSRVSRQPDQMSGQPPLQATPRSLTSTLVIRNLSDPEIITEIELIQRWLDLRTSSDPQQEDRVLTALSALGNTLMQRHPDVLEAVQQEIASTPASGSTTLALTPGGPFLLAKVTRTGVRIAGQRAVQSGATALASGSGGAAGAGGGGMAGSVGGAAAGVSAVGLGLWGLLIFVFFAPRGEYLPPQEQKAIGDAIRVAAARTQPKVQTQTKTQPAPKPAPQALPVSSTCVAKARQLSAQGCNFIAVDPRSDPLGRKASEDHPQAELYCRTHAGADPCEYWLYPPGGQFGTVAEWARFDAFDGGTLLECKCGYEGFLDALEGGGLPFERAIARSTMDKMIRQALQHQRRAAECGIPYRMVVSSRRLADYLRQHGPHDLDIEVRPDELCD